MNADLQGRLASIESKAALFDNNFQSVGERENQSQSLMNELADKTEKRLHNLEDVIGMLNNE